MKKTIMETTESGFNNTTQLYEALLACSNRMLNNARQKKWQELMQDEAELVKFIERISSEESTKTLSAEEASRHREIMKQVMTRSEQTQMLLFNRKDELDVLINAHPPCTSAVFSCEEESANDEKYTLH